jgi:photosystem II stability/assembly factor-like uncharacterized protein
MSDTWELLARWPGGTVAALAVVEMPGWPALVLAATAAGLHVSSDGGRSWRWAGLGPTPVPEALAVSSGFATDHTVLLGTAGGLFRSTDGGRSWRPTLVGSRVQSIAVSPSVAEGGVVLAGTESDGIFRSDDGGSSWLSANAGLLDLNVTAVALSPTFGRDRTCFAATASGLYRSRTGGRAWRLVELGPEAPAVQCLAVSPSFAEDGIVLAGTERYGLFRSDDAGQSWEPVSAFPEPSVTGLAVSAGAASRSIVAGTAAGVAVSRDGGETWSLEAPELGPILSVVFVDDGTSEAILAGTIDAGVVRRAADRPSWSPANHGLAGRATVCLAAAAVPAAAAGDALLAVASLDAGVLVSPDGGASWTTGRDGLADLAASSVAIVPASDRAPTLLATFGDGLYRSDDTGSSWRRVVLPGASEAGPSSLSVAGGPGLSTSSVRPVLTAGGSGLHLSVDGGASWRAIPRPDSRAEIVGAAASPDLGRDRTIYVVARAIRLAADGSAEPAGLVFWRSTDLGQHWARWLEAPDATVLPVAVPGAGDLEAAVLVGRPGRVARPLRDAREQRRGERRPIWQEARIGAPRAAVTALALSPHVRRDRTVLAAADAGVYLSRDGGAAFDAWDHGLDVPLITALTVVPTPGGAVTAYALGLGGTLWRRRL